MIILNIEKPIIVKGFEPAWIGLMSQPLDHWATVPAHTLWGVERLFEPHLLNTMALYANTLLRFNTLLAKVCGVLPKKSVLKVASEKCVEKCVNVTHCS